MALPITAPARRVASDRLHRMASARRGREQVARRDRAEARIDLAPHTTRQSHRVFPVHVAIGLHHHSGLETIGSRDDTGHPGVVGRVADPQVPR
jgi:hypothetical protein